MKVHFIAIGGAAMHNLAIALKIKGYQVTGSDDEIFDPSKSRLEKYDILPSEMGWFVERITDDIDAVILGMHARIDNPELLEAKKKGLRLFSYPEYIFEQSKDKNRVVIGGSHGKTSITAMILHALEKNNVETDYMVGAQLPQFDCMVKLTQDTNHIVLEGDEYLSSPIDLRPKFHLYKPNVALLSGIAWDHINVFPTFDNYVDQFRKFIGLIEPGGTLIYFSGDSELQKLVKGVTHDIKLMPYSSPEYIIKDGKTMVHFDGESYEMMIFGEHNLQNLNGARLICETMGIQGHKFFSSMISFGGAANRLEKIYASKTSVFYKDFAHSPSKLKATTKAVKDQFPHRKLVACMELHTFSSLNSDFLPQYEGAMSAADIAIVFYNPEVVAHKKLKEISPDDLIKAFGQEGLIVFSKSEELLSFLRAMEWSEHNLLMMSSGNFDGVDYKSLSKELFF